MNIIQLLYYYYKFFIDTLCNYRADYRHGYSNAKPVLAKITQEWEDNEVFQRYLDACAVEAKENKVSLNWYAYYAQKPLEE